MTLDRTMVAVPMEELVATGTLAATYRYDGSHLGFPWFKALLRGHSVLTCRPEGACANALDPPLRYHFTPMGGRMSLSHLLRYGTGTNFTSAPAKAWTQ